MTSIQTHEFLNLDKTNPNPSVPTSRQLNTALSTSFSFESDFTPPTDADPVSSTTRTLVQSIIEIPEAALNVYRPTSSTSLLSSEDSISLNSLNSGTVYSCTSNVVASLPLRYNDFHRNYFDPDLPIGLEGLLSQQLFAQRIHLINAHLSKYYTISDFTAHIRLWILLITSILLICPLIWYQELSTNVFWALVCSGFGITMIGVPLTFRKHSYEAFVECRMEEFNHMDTHVTLSWTSRRLPHWVPLLDFQFKSNRMQVPWRIDIEYSSKTGQLLELLPEYQPWTDRSFMHEHNELAGEERRRGSQLPSYKSREC